MAVTLQAQTGVTYDKLRVDYVDYLHNLRSVVYPVARAATQAQVETFINALEPLTNATVCAIDRQGQAYDVDGAEPVVNAPFGSTYDKAMLTYTSDDQCKDSITIVVPAPIPALFTGAQRQIVDPNNAALVAFNAAFRAIAISPKTGAVDMSYNVGYRAVDMLDKPNVF